MNMNRVFLGGRVTRDIELKYTPTNQSVARIGMAVNNNYTTKAGEKKEEVLFIDCTVWGKTAEFASNNLNKGSNVVIEGRLKLEQWDDSEGKRQSRISVTVDQLHLTGAKPAAAPASAAPAKTTARREPQQQEFPDDDDIPF